MRFNLILIIITFLALGHLESRAPGPDWVQSRVDALQPTDAQMKWSKVSFVRSLDEALQLARVHRRPVFFASVDGELDSGRC
ncbi:MAG: hypothetical protein FJX76_04150 [Armatimonadetes bacterium]|nr:hypothetical protein [Armatimonadota bacterium]